MKKNLANILTAFRGLIALYLLSFHDISGKFLKWFTVAGLTDVLDGPIARKTGSVSLNGSRLDTVADSLLFSSIAKIFIRKRIFKKGHYIIFVIGILGLAVSAVIGAIKFGKLFFIHSAAAKALGVGCFCAPYFYLSGLSGIVTTIVCVILVLLAIESVIIQIRSSHPMPDVLSVFSKSINSRTTH